MPIYIEHIFSQKCKNSSISKLSSSCFETDNTRELIAAFNIDDNAILSFYLAFWIRKVLIWQVRESTQS